MNLDLFSLFILRVIFGLAGIVLGIIFIWLGCTIQSSFNKQCKRCKCSTKALIVDIVREALIKIIRENEETPINILNKHKEPIMYDCPIYEYTINEKTIRKKGHVCNVEGHYKIGQEVEIYYNMDDYNDFYEVIDKSHRISQICMSIGCISIGLVMILIGSIIFFGLIKVS